MSKNVNNDVNKYSPILEDGKPCDKHSVHRDESWTIAMCGLRLHLV